MTALTLPDGRIPDLAYWMFLGWPPHESDVRNHRFPSTRLVERYARQWKPHWPVTLQHIADAEGCTVEELIRELACEQLAYACGRAERVTNHWPSVSRPGQRRGQPRALIPLARVDLFYDESLAAEARADALAWYFDRGSL